TQKQSLTNYQIGDLIRFNKGIQNTVYTQGAYFTILEINHTTNELLLANNGNSYELNVSDQIAKKLSLYRAEVRELQIGELLFWNDNTPKELQVNSDFTRYKAKIINIFQNQEIELTLENAQRFIIDLTKNKNQHIEYAYAKTLNKVAHQEFVNGAILLNNNLQTITLTEIYTALSSIKGNRKIYCDNIEMLKQSMSQHLGLKEYAHLQAKVGLDRNVQNNDFAMIKGELAGNLENYTSMLSAILPEINFLTNKNNQELNFPKTPEYLEAINAVNFAVLKLSERDAVFSAQELLFVAKKYDIKIASNLVEIAIDQVISEGLVINKGENSLLTKEVYAMECACLKIQKQGEGVLDSIIIRSNPILDAIKEHKYFTRSQKQAVLLILTSNDRVNLIQGIAGSGKTSMLKEVKNLAIDAGFQLLGVANPASAKNNLQNKTRDRTNVTTSLLDVGIPSKTLTSFLNEANKMLASNYNLTKQIYPTNTIFILDEASLVSVRDMFNFLYIVEKLDARAVIVGDHEQLASIGASHPFKLLLGKSNSKVVMNINTRLKTKEALKLIQDIYAVRIDDAFDKLLNNLVEIPNREERLQEMANYYLAANKEDRAEIMPMLPLNKDRVD
ncbi:MAG: AAA family ATPase, partial [Gammaproteobacteria bacterium]